jgi:hypothetical protein
MATLNTYFTAASHRIRRSVLIPVIAAVALFALFVAPALGALGDTTAQQAKLVRHSGVWVAGTIDCTPPSPYAQGGSFNVTVYVTQGSGNTLNQSRAADLTGTCPKSGPGTWAATLKGDSPFRAGKAVVVTKGFACSVGLCDLDEMHGQEFMLQP